MVSAAGRSAVGATGFRAGARLKVEEITRKWDAGNRKQRLEILETLLSWPDLPRVMIGEGSMLFFSRLLNWLKITYMFGFAVSQQLLAMNRFLQMRGRYLHEFILAGGVQLLHKIISAQSVENQDKALAIQTLRDLAVMSKSMGELVCSMKSTRIVARVLSQSEPPVSSHVVEQGHELFVALGMSNPEFQWEILEDLFEIMQDDRNEAAQISALLASKRIFLNAKGMLAAVTNPAVRQQLVPKVVACSMAMLMSRHERVRAEAETFLSDIRIVPGADLVLVRHLARALVHFLSAVPDTGDTERDREAAAEPPPGVEESSESSLSRSADARIEEEGHRDGPYPTTEVKVRAAGRVLAIAARLNNMAKEEDVDTRQNNWSAGQAGNTLESVLMGMGMDERHELLEILKEQQDAAYMSLAASFQQQELAARMVGVISQSLYFEIKTYREEDFVSASRRAILQNQTRRSLLSAFAGGVSKSRLGAKLPVLGEEREGAEEEEGGQEQEDEGGDGAGAGGEGGSANTSREGSRNEEPSSLEARQEGRPKHPSQNRIHTALVRGVSMAQEEGDMVAAGVPASALAERLHGLVKTGGSMEMQGVVTDMASRPETPVDEEKLSGEAQVGRDKRSRLGTRVTVFADLDSISEGGSEPSSAAGRRQLSRQESTQRFRSSQNPCVADSRNPSVAEALPRVVKERPRWTSAFGDMLEKEDPHGSLDRDILDLKLMLGEPADSKHKAGTPSQDERCEVVLDAAVSALQIPEGGRQSTPGPSDHESQPVFMMTAGEDELPGPRRRERRRPKGEGSEEMLKGDGIMTHRDLRSKFADRVQRVAPVLKMIAWAGKQIADDGRSGAGNQALAEEKGISDNCAERVSWEHSHDTARPLSTSPERTSSSHRASCDGVGSAGSVAHGGSCGSEPVQEETQAALRQDSVQDMRRSSNETASVPHDDNVLPDKANNLIAGKLGYGVQSLEDHPQQTKTRHKPKGDIWGSQPRHEHCFIDSEAGLVLGKLPRPSTASRSPSRPQTAPRNHIRGKQDSAGTPLDSHTAMQNARLSGHSGGEGSSQRALPGPSVNGRQLTVRGTLRRALNTREPAARDNAEPKSDEVTLLDVLGLEKDRDAVDSAFKPPSGAPALLRASSGRRHTFFEGATGEVDLDGAGWVDSRSKPAKHTTSGKSSSTPVGVGNYASHADEMRKDAWTAKVLMGTKEEELLGESAEHDTDGRWGMDSASPFTSRRSLQDTAEDGKKPEKASSTVGDFIKEMKMRATAERREAQRRKKAKEAAQRAFDAITSDLLVQCLLACLGNVFHRPAQLRAAEALQSLGSMKPKVWQAIASHTDPGLARLVQDYPAGKVLQLMASRHISACGKIASRLTEQFAGSTEIRTDEVVEEPEPELKTYAKLAPKNAIKAIMRMRGASTAF